LHVVPPRNGPFDLPPGSLEGSITEILGT
jgi:hypothetical protein